MVFKVQNKNKSAVQKSSTEDVIIIDDDDSDGGDTITAEADNADQQDEVIIIDENGCETKVGPSKVTELRQQATSKKNCENSSKKRSRSTDMEDFEKFCRHFNKKISALKDSDLEITVKGSSSENGINDTAFEGDENLVFKKPQRFRRRTTAPSMEVSLGPASCERLTRVRNNNNSVKQNNEPFDIVDGEIKAIENLENVSIMNVKVTKVQPKSGPKSDSANSTNETISSSPPQTPLPRGRPPKNSPRYRQKQMASNATSNGAGGPSHSVTRSGSRPTSPLEISAPKTAPNTPENTPQKKQAEQLTPTKKNHSSPSVQVDNVATSSNSSNSTINNAPTKSPHHRNGNNPHYYSRTTSTFSPDKNEEFRFEKPGECPIFEPNAEEFKNPLAYISKIRPIAEKYGICKIRPPKAWTPPFTVDVDKLRFTPRVQRLNELEAKTRVKLNFLDQIAKFWELQGSSLKIPMVERKALDLYSLHRIVQEEGGMEVATKDRKWSRIGQRLGYPAGKNVGTILRGHYERILHPFDVYTSGKVVDSKLETDDDDKDYKPHGIVSRQQITPPNETTARRSKRFANSNASCGLGSAIMDEKFCKIEKFEEDQKATDYRRLHLYGTGTKPGNNRNSRSRMSNVPNFMSPHKKTYEEYDPLAKYICQTCNRGDVEEAMLLCDGCDDSYHTFCLIPPLSDIPKGDWRCPKCVVEEVSKPQDAFGFEQASREYTLQQFGEMADHFKSDYFNMAVHLVPTDLVEREFWRIVSSIDEDVTVEYGADLHTMDHGSGFPTKNSLYLLPNDEEYADSSWNLNNLPLLEESVLGHINADISGMKVPWMYVGMCFATFCWHNEDHWSYSINYLHWGEAKTWYGVPGDHAESFEKTMRSAAPELFQSQPDLLHQLVTIMNPNILMGSGVPVYRTDQHAGEFVITFPRAYHAGFNQGYNFAEAVNFAPADWMKMGRECINHYSKLRRFCVFSHDELVCKMALDPDRLNLSIATACYLDMVQMVDCEKKLRKSLLEWGVTKAEREPFELLPDDGRQCESCKTTVFLSAVSCTCTQAIACLRHYTELCKCHPENYTLKYRYTLDELPLMLKKLKVKAESFENWLTKVRDVLDPSTPVTLTLEELQELALEAVTKKFPRSILLDRLNSAVIEAKKCVTVIQQLDINKMRTRTRNSNESAKYRLTLTELDLFVEEINNLCCIIQEGESVRKLQCLGKEFVEMSDLHLAKPLEMVDAKVIERLIDVGSMLCIELAEVKVLKRRLDQVNWYNQIDQYAKSNEKKTVEEIKALKKEGLALIPDPAIDKHIEYLENIIIGVEEWERLSQKCFESGTQHQLEEIEEILKKAESIPATLPSQPNLKDAVKRTKDWLQNLEILQERETYPYFHTLQSVVERGRGIPFQLEELARMEDHLNSAQLWKDRTARTFLKKNTNCSLLEILSPRIDAINLGPKGKKKIAEEIFSEEMGPPQVVNAFKNAEEKELKDMRELRKLNDAKHPLEDKFCICKRKFHGLMFHCQLCKDWFHEGCVPTPRHTVRPRPRTSNTTPPGTSNILPISIQERDFEPKYLCPTCMRSRKPRLESILGLLVSLQRLPMRLPEGEALQCLTERAMNWQDRARQAFATEDVAAALTALSITTQKNNDTEGPKSAESTTQHNDDETSKVEEQKPVEDESVVISSDEEENPEQTNENDIGKQNEAATSTAKIEHAYSVPPSTVPNDVQSSNIANSPHKPDMPLIHLCKSTKDKLKDLMMEGDLLEVSLDETLHIWQVLNAAKPYITELACLNYRYNISNTKTDVLVNNVKKRRSDDITGPPPKRVAKCTVGDKSAVQKAKKGRKMKTVTKQNTNDSKKKKRGKKTKRTAAAGSSSDDEEEECSAPVCEKPDGTEVDWVQCDGYCNNWFHMLCVGLDKNSIKPEEDFICELCKSTGAKPSSEHGTVILTISTASVQSSPKSSNSPIPMLSPSDISTSSSTLTATETPVKSDIQFPSIQSTLNVLDVISTPSETESLSEKNLSSPTVVRS